jgi:hypothetical protein
MKHVFRAMVSEDQEAAVTTLLDAERAYRDGTTDQEMRSAVTNVGLHAQGRKNYLAALKTTCQTLLKDHERGGPCSPIGIGFHDAALSSVAAWSTEDRSTVLSTVRTHLMRTNSNTFVYRPISPDAARLLVLGTRHPEQSGEYLHSLQETSGPSNAATIYSQILLMSMRGSKFAGSPDGDLEREHLSSAAIGYYRSPNYAKISGPGLGQAARRQNLFGDHQHLSSNLQGTPLDMSQARHLLGTKTPDLVAMLPESSSALVEPVPFRFEFPRHDALLSVKAMREHNARCQGDGPFSGRKTLADGSPPWAFNALEQV